jgi:K+-transporting ATPase KdpF subunit
LFWFGCSEEERAQARVSWGRPEESCNKQLSSGLFHFSQSFRRKMNLDYVLTGGIAVLLLVYLLYALLKPEKFG